MSCQDCAKVVERYANLVRKSREHRKQIRQLQHKLAESRQIAQDLFTKLQQANHPWRWTSW